MRDKRIGLIAAGILAISLSGVPGSALAQLGGFKEIVALPGDDGSSSFTPEIAFSVGGTALVAGGTSTINFDLSGAAQVTSGHLVVQLSPPLFVGTPSIGLHGGSQNLVVGLAPLGAGIYRIDFGAPLSFLDLQPGQFLSLAGVADPALMVGDPITVQLSAAATPVAGSSLSVVATGATRTVGLGTDALVLRVTNRKDLLAGDLVTIEIRTYNPKPISEGQVCFQFATTFFAKVSRVMVQAPVTDVSYSVDTTTAGVMVVQFGSPSAAINSVDGPLILVEMRLSPTLLPGATTTVDVDVAQSYLFDNTGLPVTVLGSSGTFVVGN